MSSIATLLIALVASVLASWWLFIRMPDESHAGAIEPMSEQERTSAQRLRADVRRLAAEIGERSTAHPSGLDAAAAHIEQVFRELGLAVALHVYDSRGRLVRNVEATLAGTNGAGEIVLVGAHYDSLIGTTGANDNASGVAAMLELARLLAGKPLPRTVRFVAFVNEEPPYFDVGEMGSQFYASHVASRGDRIVAMMSLETMGYYSDAAGSQLYPFPLGLFYPSRGNFIAFVGNVRSRSLVHRSVVAFRANTRFPSEGVAAPQWIPGVSWSDQASFWAHGCPAIMITDTALYRYPYYHTVQDVPEHVDFDRLARVVTGLIHVIDDLARR